MPRGYKRNTKWQKQEKAEAKPQTLFNAQVAQAATAPEISDGSLRSIRPQISRVVMHNIQDILHGLSIVERKLSSENIQAVPIAADVLEAARDAAHSRALREIVNVIGFQLPD